MSTQFTPKPYGEPAEKPKIRVYGFVDGFNLYHALENFEPAKPVADPGRYRKYKWLCLTSLISRYVAPKSEVLAGVQLFTAYPNWPNTQTKRSRHEMYVAAQEQMGVKVTLGEFKPKGEKCQARCGYFYQSYVEKQTDINIAVALIEMANLYDKAILLTADSDQVPSVNLLRRLHPDKRVAVLPPIGRGAKDLILACDEQFKMTEQHLGDSQFPSPMPMLDKNRRPTPYFFVKPSTWS